MENSRAKDTLFYRTRTLNCRGKILTLDRLLVMGVLNVTPDSFYDGGRYEDEASWILQTRKMVEEGADIIDIGAASTRPGAKEVSAEEELRRLIPVLSSVKKHFPDMLISVDTFRASIAQKCVNAGASMINDISGGTFDKGMIPAVSELKVPYIIMHIRGTPADMQKNPVYGHLLNEMLLFFAGQVEKLMLAGINDVIIDPGFGFGKSLEDNFTILNHLERFHFLGKPLMVGLSRKSMINKVLGTKPGEALNGTTVLNTIALLKGADILRVHDVKEAVEAVKLVEKLKEANWEF